jgi:phospholipid/cholesterol/gamma-HCH transport system substrate-binding protein
VGLVIFLGMTVVAAAITSFGHLTQLFQPRQTISAVFSDIRGLRHGAPVWVGGMESGNVEKILFPRSGEEKGIKVEMLVNSEMAALVRSDSKASIRTQGLLGEMYMEISLGGPEAPPLSSDHAVKGVVPVDMKDLIAGSSEALGDLDHVLQNLNELMEKIAEGQGAIGRFVNDPSLYQELTQLTSEARNVLLKFENGEGTAAKLLRDPALFHQLSALASRSEATVESFEKFTYELRKGKGTVGRLASDPELYNNLIAATSRLDRLLIKIEAGEGLAGQLVNNQELTEEMRSAVVEFKSAASEFRKLVEDIKENPKRYFRFRLF